jgi:hypothetical protein
MNPTFNFIYVSITYLHIWCPVAALVISLFRSRLFGRFSITKFAEQFFIQMLFWVVGIECIVIFVLLMWFPASAGTYAYPNHDITRFTYDLSMVNLSFGILGFASLLSSLGYQTATALGYSIWIFGDGLGHLHSILSGTESSPNIRSLLYTDLVIPLVILVALMIVYQNHKSKA